MHSPGRNFSRVELLTRRERGRKKKRKGLENAAVPECSKLLDSKTLLHGCGSTPPEGGATELKSDGTWAERKASYCRRRAVSHTTSTL